MRALAFFAIIMLVQAAKAPQPAVAFDVGISVGGKNPGDVGPTTIDIFSSFDSNPGCQLPPPMFGDQLHLTVQTYGSCIGPIAFNTTAFGGSMQMVWAIGQFQIVSNLENAAKLTLYTDSQCHNAIQLTSDYVTIIGVNPYGYNPPPVYSCTRYDASNYTIIGSATWQIPGAANALTTSVGIVVLAILIATIMKQDT